MAPTTAPGPFGGGLSTHAALSLIVWNGAKALWEHGGPSIAGVASVVGAVAIFAVGTALTFGLEGLVAAIQALRLEYYELFSRVFVERGRPFRPWQVPTAMEDTTARMREAVAEEVI